MFFDMIGLTNALMDIIVEVSDEELERFGLKKGFYNRRSELDVDGILRMVADRDKKLVPGGSPANTMHGAAKLGLSTALLGTVGTDDYGREYIIQNMGDNLLAMMKVVDGQTGAVYILVTSDGEKTSFADVGVAANYDHDISGIDSAFFHTSGYELCTNPEKTLELALGAARKGMRLSFDLADPKMVVKQVKNIERLLSRVEVLFTTEEEAQELTGYLPESALRALSCTCKIVVMKKGSKGSVVRTRDSQFEIPVFPAKVVDTDGAGDAYAAGFLAAYVKGLGIEKCGSMGSAFAAAVCSVKGARYF